MISYRPGLPELDLAETRGLHPRHHILRSQILCDSRLNTFRNYAAIVGLFI